MTKGRRTRKQKLVAKQKPQMRYTLPTMVLREEVKEAKKESLFTYDPQLIRSDLTKTAILAMLAVATIVAIYYFKLI